MGRIREDTGRRTVITGVGKSSASVITSQDSHEGPGCNLSVGSVARREKRTARAIIWGALLMQDANNERGTRRTNDVRLFVHSSHSDAIVCPRLFRIRRIQNRGWALSLIREKQKLGCNCKTCQFVTQARGTDTNCFNLVLIAPRCV